MTCGNDNQTRSHPPHASLPNRTRSCFSTFHCKRPSRWAIRPNLLVLDKNRIMCQTPTAVRAYPSTLGYMDSRGQDLQRRAMGCLKTGCSRRWKASIAREASSPKSRSSPTAIATVSGVVAPALRLLTGVLVTEDCKRVRDVWLCFGGGG
jgi:hypothetical protein